MRLSDPKAWRSSKSATNRAPASPSTSPQPILTTESSPSRAQPSRSRTPSIFSKFGKSLTNISWHHHRHHHHSMTYVGRPVILCSAIKKTSRLKFGSVNMEFWCLSNVRMWITIIGIIVRGLLCGRLMILCLDCMLGSIFLGKFFSTKSMPLTQIRVVPFKVVPKNHNFFVSLIVYVSLKNFIFLLLFSVSNNQDCGAALEATPRSKPLNLFDWCQLFFQSDETTHFEKKRLYSLYPFSSVRFFYYFFDHLLIASLYYIV